jgi:DNA-binding beta-propeller fold protein YncE
MAARSVILTALLLTLASSLPAFAHPGSGIAVDKQGTVYCVDQMQDRLLRITPDGKVTTLARGIEGEGDKRQVRFVNPHHLVQDAAGNLFTCGDGGNTGVWKVQPSGEVTRYYPPDNWYQQILIGSGGDPFGLDAKGNLYCWNERQFRFSQILKVSPEGRVSSFVGGDWGLADGERETAMFGSLHSATLRFAPDGCLYMTERACIRKITPEGKVSTLAGAADCGFADATGKEARFGSLSGLAVGGDGRLYVVDDGNLRIRVVSPEGRVSTLAGNGQRGGKDGKAAEATFEEPAGVAFDEQGKVYVLELVTREGRPRVRTISSGGEVTTLADLSKTPKPAK